MHFLYQSAFAEALGWSLIDSLWQMGAVWVFYILITRNGRKFTSQQRHSLALIGSTVGMMLFVFSIAKNYIAPTANPTYYILPFFVKFVPFLSIIYVPAVAFFALRMLWQINENKSVYRKNLLEAESKIAGFVNEMTVKSGILKKVSIWITDNVDSPLTIGFWKPVILLPVAVFMHLSCKQVEAVIMHELHHIKRNDYIINIFLTVAEVVFFFNPFAHMMFGTVKKERENSCDDFVIASGFDAWEYSQALYILGRHRNEKNNLAIAATGDGKEYLLQRIRRIMKKNNASPSVLKPFAAFFLCLFVAGFAARQKQIPALPPKADNVYQAKPVVFYSETKEIVVDRAVVTKTSVPTKKLAVSKRSGLAAVKVKKTERLAEPAVLEDVTDNDVQSNYVAAPTVIAFTFVDPPKPVVPVIVCESPQPYIQKSSFYFTEVDTTAGKRIINL